jgi:hypothetical protein
MFFEQLREMVPPPSQNTVGLCNQITLLVLYCISSRLVMLLKITEAPLQVSDIFLITVSFKLINYIFQIFHKCLLIEYKSCFGVDPVTTVL